MKPAFSPPESLSSRWLRRAVTIPGYLLISALSIALLPILLPLTVVTDLVLRNRLALTRTLALLSWYFAMESAGLFGAALLWGLRPFLGAGFARANFRLQCLWARALFGGARWLFGMRVEAAGLESLRPGPVLVMMRHASVADTLLPAVLVSNRTGLRLRYVMKRELLWDPCLDVVGQRLPNAFVRRGTRDAAQIGMVRALAADLDVDEGVLLYPEGTRWTPARRRRVIDRLSRSADPKLLERAQALQWLLPPRLGGVLALLEAAPQADVVFAVHTGFEGVRTLADVWAGALVGTRVQVRFERIPASAIPAEREARIQWILDHWTRLDAWLDAHVVPSAASPSPRSAA
ncbi:lysophospholipid acyltransferase family protein [Myxococcota bacterium]|nr:lysophospholipid acyltransferase family protein [Myxococcota bacterium]MCZ7619025.1 lysophospholipid acyltransferase family protein [Myxococcota bacterium]